MRKMALSGALLLLAGCGTVDQFSSRVSEVNDNVASAGADDVLRNILRAADNEPLTFVAVSKITGQRSADLKVGLPTITLGKGQTVAQKQFVFAGNLLDNSLGYTLEMSPLTTNTFTNGLMQPVDPGELESLSEQGIPRELLFYMLIDSISLDPQSATPPITYHNSPWLDDAAQCPNVSFADFFDREGTPGTIRAGDRYAPFKQDGTLSPPGCEFHKFQFLLMLAIEYGLRVDTGDAPPPAGATGAAESPTAMEASVSPPKPGAATPPKPPAVRLRQHLCFDLGLANRNLGQRLVTGTELERATLCNAAGTKLDYFEINLHQINTMLPVTHIRASIRLRSTFAAFHYLGQLTRLAADRQPQMQDPQWLASGGDRALFPMRQGGEGCYLRIARAGVPWCLPHAAEAGKASISVLSLLLQMNTNRSDLPTSAVEVGL